MNQLRSKRSRLAMLHKILIIGCLIAVFLCSPVYGDKKELVILNWAEYMDMELVAQFEQQHNTRIRFVRYETDELKEELLIETDGSGYDIVVSAEPPIHSYLKRGWLAPVTVEQIPNLKHIDPRWLNAHPGLAGYVVPYFWGRWASSTAKTWSNNPSTVGCRCSSPMKPTGARWS